MHGLAVDADSVSSWMEGLPFRSCQESGLQCLVEGRDDSILIDLLHLQTCAVDGAALAR